MAYSIAQRRSGTETWHVIASWKMNFVKCEPYIFLYYMIQPRQRSVHVSSADNRSWIARFSRYKRWKKKKWFGCALEQEVILLYFWMCSLVSKHFMVQRACAENDLGFLFCVQKRATQGCSALNGSPPVGNYGGAQRYFKVSSESEAVLGDSKWFE